jgi:sortase B
MGSKLIGAIVPSFSKDSPVEVARKCIFIISFLVVIICLFVIITAEEPESPPPPPPPPPVVFEMAGMVTLVPMYPEPPEEKEPVMLEEYIDYFEQNNDMVGWIRIPNTTVNYPVVQTVDNVYYLHRTFERRYHRNVGSIFADFNVPFTPTFRPNNTLIYGHNVGAGIKFNAVALYYPYHFLYPRAGSLEAYLANPLVYFDTLYEKGIYKVFAVIFTNTRAAQGEVYHYHRQRVFPDKDSFLDFAVNIMDRSALYTDVDIRYGDEIITLSTCHYPLGAEANTRVALFARRLREGESPDVNTDAAWINPSPLFFDYFYRVRGGSWAGRNWDLSKVEDVEEYITRMGL